MSSFGFLGRGGSQLAPAAAALLGGSILLAAGAAADVDEEL